MVSQVVQVNLDRYDHREACITAARCRLTNVADFKLKPHNT